MDIKQVITDTMSFDDIARLANRYTGQLVSSYTRINSALNGDIVRFKPRRKVRYKPTTISTDSGLTFHITPFLLSYKDYKNGGLLFQTYGTFRYRGQMWAILANNRTYSRLHGFSYEWLFYTSHFFERYRERFLADDTLTVNDAIAMFFRSNLVFCLRDGQNDIFAVVPDGVALGSMKENITLFKTFVSKEMLFEDTQLTEYRQAYETLIADGKDYIF